VTRKMRPDAYNSDVDKIFVAFQLMEMHALVLLTTDVPFCS
jgi:hypothetical protein